MQYHFKAAFVAIAALGSVVSLSGCGSATYGNRIESNAVATIIKGKTTKAELIQMFGQPMQTIIMPDGGRTLYFIYYRSTLGSALKPMAQVLTGKNSQAKTGTNLQVILDSHDVVKDYDFQDGGK
jgi:hypothetical protein